MIDSSRENFYLYLDALARARDVAGFAATVGESGTYSIAAKIAAVLERRRGSIRVGDVPRLLRLRRNSVEILRLTGDSDLLHRIQSICCDVMCVPTYSTIMFPLFNHLPREEQRYIGRALGHYHGPTFQDFHKIMVDIPIKQRTFELVDAVVAFTYVFRRVQFVLDETLAREPSEFLCRIHARDRFEVLDAFVAFEYRYENIFDIGHTLSTLQALPEGRRRELAVQARRFPRHIHPAGILELMGNIPEGLAEDVVTHTMELYRGCKEGDFSLSELKSGLMAVARASNRTEFVDEIFLLSGSLSQREVGSVAESLQPLPSVERRQLMMDVLDWGELTGVQEVILLATNIRVELRAEFWDVMPKNVRGCLKVVCEASASLREAIFDPLFLKRCGHHVLELFLEYTELLITIAKVRDEFGLTLLDDAADRGQMAFIASIRATTGDALAKEFAEMDLREMKLTMHLGRGEEILLQKRSEAEDAFFMRAVLSDRALLQYATEKGCIAPFLFDLLHGGGLAKSLHLPFLITFDLMAHLIGEGHDSCASALISEWLKDGGHEFKVLLLVRRPVISWYLFEQHPEILQDYIRRMPLSAEAKVILLPAFKAEEIVSEMRALGEVALDLVLGQRTFIEEGFEASLRQALLEVKRGWVSQLNYHSEDIRQFMERISPYALACATQDPGLQECLLSMLQFLTPPQRQVVVPLLATARLIQEIRRLPFESHHVYLHAATVEQKEAYLSLPDAIPEPVPGWKEQKADICNSRGVLKSALVTRDKSFIELMQMELQTKWLSLSATLFPELEGGIKHLSRFKASLLAKGSSQVIQELIITKIDSASRRLQNITRKATVLRAKVLVTDGRASRRLEPPEEFLCPISGSIMENPVRERYTAFICDRSSIARILEGREPLSPFTRSPITFADFEPLHDLEKAIKKWNLRFIK